MLAFQLEHHAFDVLIVLVRLEKLQAFLRIAPLQDLDCLLTGAPRIHFALIRHVKIDRVTARKRPAVIIDSIHLSGGKQSESCACWPAGTTFRLLSTGQMYRVDDYGWALSGRNTIDLYMANQREMNSWGAREETIQVLQWGDPQESLRLLARHQDFRHIKRMVLELEGRHKQAAALR